MGDSLHTQQRMIADVCHRMYDRGYVVATSGNASMRAGDELLITPTATRKDELCAEDIVVCSLGASSRAPDGTPSSELDMHRAVYGARKDVRVALHAHPPYAVACSMLGISLAEPRMAEISTYTGPIVAVPYAKPGSAEQARAVEPYLTDHDALLLERHGVLVLGSNMKEAFSRLEQLEYVARVIFLVETSSGRKDPPRQHPRSRT